MNTDVNVQFETVEKILINKGLGKSGKVQRFFTHEIRRLSDPYVPFRNGPLKDTAVEKLNSIEYIQPYARRQYYEHKGNGLRGQRWTERMWANRKKDIVESVQKYMEANSK